MGAKRQHEQDLQILAGISGIEDPESCGIQIESDYFVREAKENLAEQGEIELEGETHGKSDKERQLFINEGNWTRLLDDRRGDCTLPLELSEFEKQQIPVSWQKNIDEVGHDVETEDPEQAEERKPTNYRRVVR